jgi:hypothetical protein
VTNSTSYLPDRGGGQSISTVDPPPPNPTWLPQYRATIVILADIIATMEIEALAILPAGGWEAEVISDLEVALLKRHPVFYEALSERSFEASLERQAERRSAGARKAVITRRRRREMRAGRSV